MHSTSRHEANTLCTRRRSQREPAHQHLQWNYFLAHADRTIELHAGENVSNLQFSFGKVRVHTVLFHIVSSHRSLLPSEKFGVSIEAPERDALVYHLIQTRNINGEFPAGHLPPDK